MRKGCQNTRGKTSVIRTRLAVISLVILASSLSACSGLEIGGRLGIYRVDERQESQKTYNRPSSGFCSIFPSRCNPQPAVAIDEETAK